MSNPAYLQNFGKLRKDMRKREVSDTMSASGRWDDLFLRASKPYLRKKTRRESMRRETKVYVAKGCKPIPFIPNGEVTTLLGFTSDPSKVKYRLDSPSYPSRARELSQEDRKPQTFTKLVPTEWKDVYSSLRSMVHKIRMRDRKLTRQLVKDFALLWPIRHSLAKSVGKRVEAEMSAGFTDAMLVSRTPSVPKVEVVVKAKPRKVAKSIYEEFEKNREMLASIDHAHWHAKSSWHERLTKRLAKVKQDDWESRLDGMRQDLARRQKVLLGIIEAGK
jgi:hypothetical protein